MGLREVRLAVGGPQGSGLETVMMILTPAYARKGYGVVSHREYFSNIVGRHSYILIRVSSVKRPLAVDYPPHFFGAMDAESVFTHWDEIPEGGFLLYDTGVSRTKLQQVQSMEQDTKSRVMKALSDLGVEPRIDSLVDYLEKERKVRLLPMSFMAILNVLADKFGLSRAQAQRFKSSILVGAIAGLTGLDIESVGFAVERRFKARKKVVEANKFLISKIAEEVEQEYGAALKLEKPLLEAREYLVATGNDLVAMGKMVGGVRYQAYYPITPASDESVFIEAHESLEVDGEPLGGIVVLQTEDEIAAINSVIGAAMAGARASTATSGPGFSLMVEALGLAGKSDIPIVVTYYQRPGPSTGLPTRGSQSDLLFALTAGHGEIPRVLVASGDHEEAFRDAVEAYNIAEKYQILVIHLLDKFLAHMMTNIEVPDVDSLRIERGRILYKVEGNGKFKRYPLDEPVPPRPVLGSGAIFWGTGYENDEYGHIVEDSLVRLRMVERRMRKLEVIASEIPEEERAVLYGPGDADFLVIGWGSVKGPVLEALEALESEGYRGAYLHVRYFSPYPEGLVSKVLSQFDPSRVIAAEHSYMPQGAMVATMHTGYRIRKALLKWTGRPMYVREVIDGVKKILNEGVDRVVLSYGK